MLYDFERLYYWKKKRFLRSPELVMIVLPKEVFIPSLIAFWNEQGKFRFGGNFVKYVEWFGGRLAEEDAISVINPDEIEELREASRRWMKADIDTKKIGLKPFVPIEEEIRKNEERERFNNDTN